MNMLDGLYLTPVTGAATVFVVVVCGHLYRQNWKTQPPNARMRAWLFGLPAALGLAALAFLPLKY